MRRDASAYDARVGRHAPPSVRDALRVDPTTFDLREIDPQAITVGPSDRDEAEEEVTELVERAGDLHDRLWAAARRSGSPHRLLILLQGMDTSGKGGAAKAIDRLLHPAGFGVVGFGVPTEEEQAHHFLWRHERALPSPGKIVLFDRSHYEQVLVVRVRALGPWETAFDEINAWEARLAGEGVAFLKVMLHISRAEQAERLLDRLEDPTKHWKYNRGDVDERGLWDAYQAAYQDALVRCSTEVAPWFVVPANRKWHRDWLLSRLLVETLESIPVEWPVADFDPAVEAERVRRS
jgi:PPK2 family polyphosphate:nucleotide phosphotransferase